MATRTVNFEVTPKDGRQAFWIAVDKLRTFNAFREKRVWKETPYVSLAVLQLTNECVRRCASCTSAFCPICTVFADGPAPLSTDEWLAVRGGALRRTAGAPDRRRAVAPPR